jgi:hypothetical protein
MTRLPPVRRCRNAAEAAPVLAVAATGSLPPWQELVDIDKLEID